MNHVNQLPTLRRTIYLLVIGTLMALSNPTFAQNQNDTITTPRVEGKLTFGSAVFGDEIEHKLYGGSVRIYLTKRLSVEPEYFYLRHSQNDQDQILQPNVTYDFTDPSKRLVVYGTAGVGVLKHEGRFFGNDFDTGEPRVFDTSFTTWTASVGGGVKIFVTKRFFVAPELRVGREPGVRGTVSVGYVFNERE